MPTFRENQYIKHAHYGLGVITESNADRTTIEFEVHGKKKFVTSMMVAEIVAESSPRPVPARRKKATRRPKAVAAAATAAASD